MFNSISNEDLRVFATVVRKASFAAAARELGMSPAYVSKRIQTLEQVLGVHLLHRTTRRVAISETGERVYQSALRVLDEVDRLVSEAAGNQSSPRGAIRICTSFGLGRHVIGPLIPQLLAAYPLLEVQLEVLDNHSVDVAAQGYDLDIRVGNDISPHLISRRLAGNRRILCASPAYLAKRGIPRSLGELPAHDCLIIREGEHAFGTWSLSTEQGEFQHVKVRGPLSSNQGEIVVKWARQGLGIVLRSVWDVHPLLERGELVHILPQFFQDADIWAVYPTRLTTSNKLRACVEFLQNQLENFNLHPRA